VGPPGSGFCGGGLKKSWGAGREKIQGNFARFPRHKRNHLKEQIKRKDNEHTGCCQELWGWRKFPKGVGGEGLQRLGGTQLEIQVMKKPSDLVWGDSESENGAPKKRKFFPPYLPFKEKKVLNEVLVPKNIQRLNQSKARFHPSGAPSRLGSRDRFESGENVEGTRGGPVGRDKPAKRSFCEQWGAFKWLWGTLILENFPTKKGVVGTRKTQNPGKEKIWKKKGKKGNDKFGGVWGGVFGVFGGGG